MSEGIPRHLLEKYFGGDPRLVAAFEEQADTAAQAAEDASKAVEATDTLKNATVVVLSANGYFDNERVLEVGEGIDIEITETGARLFVKDVARTQDGAVVLVSPASEVIVTVPPEGTLATRELAENLENKTLVAPHLATIGNYANDAAASAGGVAVGQVYRNGSQLCVRVA